MINRKVFFKYVRAAPFGGRLTTDQVEGLEKILNEWESRELTDDRWLANMLAQVFHETGKTMQPVREYGGEKYLRSKKYYPWVGEGLIQVTWETNHRKFGATRPGQMLTWPISLIALFDGMIKGMFTGKKLSDYFNDKVDDPIGARRIVNGTDKAKLIAGYHKNFLDSIKAAKDFNKVDEVARDEKPEVPDDVKPEKSSAILAGATAIAGSGVLGVFQNIDNPYALAAFVVMGAVTAFGLYKFFTGEFTINRVK